MARFFKVKPTYESVLADVAALEERHKEVQRELSRTRIALTECLDGGGGIEPPEPDPDPPDPPDPDPEPGTPWTHAYADMDVADAMDAGRARVTPILDAAPARVDAGYDVVYPDLHLAGRNGFISGEERKGRWGKVWGVNRVYDETGELVPRSTNLGLDNCRYIAPYSDQSTGAKWGVRMSNIPEAVFTRLMFSGQVLSGRATPKEHAVYADVSGDVTFGDCLFEDLGGHGVYVTNRAYAFQQYGQISLKFTAPPTWLCDNVVQLNNELDASRSAFNFSFYDPGSYEHPGEVVIKDCVSIQAWPFQRPQGTNERHPIEPYIQGETRASGGMVVTNFDPAHMNGVGWPTDSVVITRSVFWTVQARHNLLTLRGARTFRIKDSMLRVEGPGANGLIAIGAKDAGMRGPETVTFENVVAVGLRAEIFTAPGASTVIDLHCPGERITWTPAGGVVKEDLG